MCEWKKDISMSIPVGTPLPPPPSPFVGEAFISGGTVDNTPIGLTTKSSGAFTSLKDTSLAGVGSRSIGVDANGNIIILGSSDLSSPPAIGDVTPNTVAATTLTATVSGEVFTVTADGAGLYFGGITPGVDTRITSQGITAITLAGTDVTLAGDLIMPATGGIDFSASSSAAGMTAQVLDDYEEGTWTPILADSALVAKGATYTTNEGRYVKVGNLCYIYFRMDVTGLGTLITFNDANIIGLPFTGDNGTGPYMDQSGQMMYQLNTNLPAAGDFILGEIKDNTAYVNMGIYDASAIQIAPCLISYIGATAQLGFSMSYRTA
jgi:hypothetical protein